jgi:SET domain-containing protein
MLTVKTIVKNSDIEGLGLFAAEKITKGTTVWKFDARFDLYFELADVEKMEPLQKDLVVRYAPLSSNSKKYVYSIDDSRFMNHSSIKNNVDNVDMPGEPEKVSVANRDIEKGEEILANYREFDVNDEHSKEEYLNK